MQHNLGDLAGTDLAELFGRSVNISSPASSSYSPAQPNLAEPQEVAQEDPFSIKYSISQHYTHSAHIVQSVNMGQTSVSNFVESYPRGLSIYQILAQNNIPPASLVQSQLTLFEQADEDQRARLVQLWNLSSPQNTTNRRKLLVNKNREYQTEILDQAMENPWLQQQENITGKSFHSESGLDNDGNCGSWFEGSNLEDAETYMTSGYEQLAERDYEEQGRGAAPTHLSVSAGLIFGGPYSHAADPIYQGRGWHSDQSGQRDVGHHPYENLELTNWKCTQMAHAITVQKTEDEEML